MNIPVCHRQRHGPILEANPRLAHGALVSKVTGVSMARIAPS